MLSLHFCEALSSSLLLNFLNKLSRNKFLLSSKLFLSTSFLFGSLCKGFFHNLFILTFHLILTIPFSLDGLFSLTGFFQISFHHFCRLFLNLANFLFNHIISFSIDFLNCFSSDLHLGNKLFSTFQG
uniref:Uncharacterized protein n=1 Tax=Lepeophtheirus salmonis TaxID=72036 RepID=A0A0K2T8A6_LEPSM